MGRSGTATTDSPPTAERSANENPNNDSNLQSATVHLLDATTEVFHVPKKAEGKELFDKVVGHLKLVEKEYFGLSFLDGDGNRHWIYDDKRITRQLKGRPWEFNFEVKFYPPDPATLTDDLTRYYLTLQIRHDISTGRLPATLATHALLGSYVAQAERGDFQDTPDYDNFLRDCRLALVPSSTLFEKIRELHKQHKGETPAEAESHYLDNAKKLSMYGIFLFPAKDSKGVPVQVGVCAHGINIYCDQIRIHRFIWQNIIKIAYRRNTFTIKLQPGELDKNASLFVLKVPDYASAKRIWKCAVEHHTFFRLIQPDEKPHKRLFRWGSGRFRYQGRTHFQSKMASQMFDHPTVAVMRSHSARLASRSDENLAPEAAKQHTSPLYYADDGTSRDLTNTPEKSYTLHSVDLSGRKDKEDMRKVAKTSDAEVGECNDAIFDDSAALVHDDSRSPPAASFGLTTYSSSSLRFSPYSQTATQWRYGGAPQEQPRFNARDQHENTGFGRSQHFQNGPDISELQKENDLQFGPLHDTVVVYHPGHYEEISRSGGPMREPPVEAGDDVVFIPHTGWKLKNKNAEAAVVRGADSTSGLLDKQNELESWPIEYFVNVYHSGFEKYHGGNKDFSDFERVLWEGVEETVDSKDIDRSKYPPKSDVFVEPVMRVERCIELPVTPLRAHSSVYHCGYSYPCNDVDSSPETRHRAGKWLCSDIIRTTGASRETKSTQGRAAVHETRQVQAVSADRELASHVVRENVKAVSQPHRPFARAVHVGEVEVIEKNDVRPETYGLPSTSYDGPLESMTRAEEMLSTPLRDHASTYHSGMSVSKFRKPRIPKVHVGVKGKGEYSSSSSELSEEDNREEGGSGKRKKKAVLHMRDSSVKTSEKPAGGTSWRFDERGQKVLEKGRELLGSSNNAYNLAAYHTHSAPENDVPQLLLARTKEYDSEKLQAPNYRLFGRVRHEGEVEVVEKSDVRPETYCLPSTSYEGPLQSTTRDEELGMTPLRDYSSVYHSGISSVKTREPRMPKGFNAQGRPKKESSSEESSDAEESKQKTASKPIGLQRGDRKAGEGAGGFFSFWRSSDRRPKSAEEPREPLSANVEAYPTITSHAYTGLVDSTDKSPELESAPLRAKVSVYSSEQIGLPGVLTDYRSFGRVLHEGDVDFVEKSEVKPHSYGISYDRYDGPLQKTAPQRELLFSPLREHSAKYHSGMSWNPAIRSETADEIGVCEKSPDEKKGKDGAGGVLSFWRMSSQPKTKSRNMDERGYPIMATQAYIGDVDSVAYGKDMPREPLATGVVRQSAEGTIQGHDRGEIVESEKTPDLPPISYEEHLGSLDKGKELSSVPLHDHVAVYSSGQQDVDSPNKAGRNIADESKGSTDYRSLGQSPERKLQSTEGDGRLIPGGVDYPVITSHAYTGPLQSVSRSREIPSEPLHTIATVYSSDQPKHCKVRQRPRVFRHAVHEGDSEIIEKSDVKSDSYKLTTSPYRGQLENTYREEELPSAPIRDHSSVYHSGISFIKPKKPKLPKFGFGFKKTKLDETSSAESSSDEEVVGKEANESIVSARVPSAEKGKSDESGHFSFWRPHGWKTKAFDGTSGPDVSVEYSTLEAKTYTGPVGSIDRSKDMATEPLDIQVKDEQGKKPRLRHRLKDYRLFMRACHDGEVEFIEKVNVKPESYNLSSVPYSGVLQHTKRDEDLPLAPIREYASVYHPGISFVKVRKPKLSAGRIALTKKTDEETSSESSSKEDTDEGGKTSGGLFSFWRLSDRKPKATETSHEKVDKGYPEIKSATYSDSVHDTERTKELESGPLNARIQTQFKKPRLKQRLGDYRLFGRVCHRGETEIVEKTDVIAESYRLPLDPYEGALDTMYREEELPSAPVRDYACVYHPGLSYVKTKKKKAKLPVVAAKLKDLEEESVSESSSEESDDEGKRKALLFMKGDVSDGEKSKDGRGGLFTFWRSSDRKKKGSELVAHPTVDAYSKQAAGKCIATIGDTVKQEEMKAEPWRATTDVPLKAKPRLRQRLGDYRLFGRLTYGGETEIVDKKDVRPESYKLSAVRYDGVLLDDFPTRDLEFIPIRDLSSVYHSGQSYVKPKKVKLWDVSLKKNRGEPSSESSSDESIGKDQTAAKSAKEGGSGLFSFWHSPARRPKETEIPQKQAVVGANQPLVQEPYAGQGESIMKTKELESERWEIAAKTQLPGRLKLRDRLADYRLFGRVCHEGEEDTVSKNDVNPETYKVSLVPYTGDLENTRKNEELKFTPIRDYSSIYHPGISYVKRKKVRGPTVGIPARGNMDEESPSESSDEEDINNSKKKAELQAQEPLGDTSKEDRSGLFSFWRSSERRAKIAEAATGQSSTEDYPKVPSQPYSGPVHDTRKTDEMKAEPWHLATGTVRAKGPKLRERLNDYRLFRRVTHEGEVELVDKKDVDSESYRVPLGRYEGDLLSIKRDDELSSTPIGEYATVYHPGMSFVKVKGKKTPKVNADVKRGRLKSSSESSSDESADEKPKEKDAKGASSVFSFWRATERKAKEEKIRPISVKEIHPMITSAFPAGNVSATKKTEEMPAEPLPTMPKMHGILKPKLRERQNNYRLFGRVVHGGDVDIIEKEHVKPETYGLSIVPFEGKLESIGHENELSYVPISEHSSVYHHGQSFVKTRKTKPLKAGLGLIGKKVDESSSESSSEEEVEESKKRSLLHVKGASADEARKPDASSSLFSFWRSSDSKAKGASVAQKAAPGSSAIVSKGPNENREAKPTTEQSGAEIHMQKKPKLKERLNDYRLFSRSLIGGDTEVIEKQDVRPEAYKLSTESYSGPLESTSRDNEMSFEPIRDHSSVYHPGASYVKSKKALSARLKFFGKEKGSEDESESSDSGEREANKLGAVLHIKDATTEAGKGKEGTGGLFSFWRSSERKAKDQKGPSEIIHSGFPAAASLEPPDTVQEITRTKEIPSAPLGTTGRHFKQPRLRERLGDYRLFRRIIHGGEVEVVDKGNVNADSYKLSTDPYSGDLENTTRAEELSFVPIRDYSSIYHPGMSFVRVKKPSKQPKSLAGKGDEQSTSESLSEEGEKEKKQKAILYVKGSKAADEGGKERTSGLFSFWRSSDQKPKDVSDVQNATEKQFPAGSSAYAGPVDYKSQTKETASQLFQSKITSQRHGRIKLCERLGDYRLFRREICGGDQEFVEKDFVKPETYKLPSAPYTGDLERSQPAEELEFCPVRDHSCVYHPGTSYVRTTRKTGKENLKGKDEHGDTESGSESSSYESDIERKRVGSGPNEPGAYTEIHAKAATDVDRVDETTRTAEFTSEPLPVGTRFSRPKLRDRIGDYRLFGRSRHEGEVSFIEKEGVEPESYGLSAEQYNGPLETTPFIEELSFRPIRDYAKVYHSGKSFVRTVGKRPLKTQRGRSEEFSDSSSEEGEALPTEAESSEDKNIEGKGGFFSFWRSSERKSKTEPTKTEKATISSCLPAQQIQVGPEETIHRSGEIAYEPLRTKVDVYHSGLPQIKGSSRARTFSHATHEGEVVIVDKADVKPETYGISSVPYEGPLSRMEKEQELPSASIHQYTSVYHPGQSYVKSRRLLPLSSFGKKEDLASGASSEEEGKVEESKKANKHPAESAKASGSKAEKGGKFSFWRSGAHKSKDKDEGAVDEHISDDLTAVPKAYILDQTEEICHGSDYRFFARSVCPGSVEIIRKEDVKPESYKVDSGRYNGPLEKIRYTDELPSTPIRDLSSVYHSGRSDINVAKPAIESEQMKETPSDRTQEKKKERQGVAGGFMSFLTGRKLWQPEDQHKVSDEVLVPSSVTSSSEIGALLPSKELASEPFVESKEPDTSALIHAAEGVVHGGVGEHVKKADIDSPSHKLPLSKYEDHLESLSSQMELPVAPLREFASAYHSGTSYIEEKVEKEVESLDSCEKTDEANGGLFAFWKGRKPKSGDEKKSKSGDEVKPKGGDEEKIPSSDPHSTEKLGDAVGRSKAKPAEGGALPSYRTFDREVHGGDIEIIEKTDVKPETYRIKTTRWLGHMEKINHEDELPTAAIGDFCSVYHLGQSVMEGSRGEDRREAVKSEKDSRHLQTEQGSGDHGSKRGLFSFWRTSERETKDGDSKNSDQNAPSPAMLSAYHGPVDEISRTKEIAPTPYNVDNTVESSSDGVPLEGTSTYTFRRVTDYDSRTDATEKYPSVIGRRIELSSIKSDLGTASDAGAPHVPALFGQSSPAGVGPVAVIEESTERMPSFYTLQTYVSDPYSTVKSGPAESAKHEGVEESRSSAAYLLSSSRGAAEANSGEAVVAAEDESGGSGLSPSTAMDETPRTLIGYIKRRITQSVTKSSEKRETKKKIEKKKAKNAADGGGSTSSSDTESKERQHRPGLVRAKENIEATEQLLSPSKEAPMFEGPIQLAGRTGESNQLVHEVHNELTNVTNNRTDDEQELSRTKEAEMFEGRLLLEKRVDNTYRIGGTGISPTIDPNDTSLASTIKQCEMRNLRTPHVNSVETNVTVKQHGPLPHIVVEGSAPHTTVESWHESNDGPESVVTDVDKYGNVIRKTVKTQQVKHTIQRQTYQTYSITEKGGEPGVQTVEASQQVITPIGEGVVAVGTTPVIETRSHTVAYEAGQEPIGSANGFQRDDIPGELISCRTITSGNRTVETITYKTEKDGVVEIHVEHRVTIQSGANIDHDAELSQAILEATNMNPDMTVEKIEVKQESQC